MVDLPTVAISLNTLFCAMRLFLQTRIEVESIKDIPVHWPRQQVFMYSVSQGQYAGLHGFNKTVVRDRVGKFLPKVVLDVTNIKILEGPYPAQMEQNGNGKDLTGGHGKFALSGVFSPGKLAFFKCRFKNKAKIIDGTEYFSNFIFRNHEQNILQYSVIHYFNTPNILLFLC